MEDRSAFRIFSGPLNVGVTEARWRQVKAMQRLVETAVERVRLGQKLFIEARKLPVDNVLRKF